MRLLSTGTLAACQLAAAPLHPQETRLREPATVDRIIVGKSEHKLYLLADGWVIRSYDIALGRKPTGRKICKGDQRTPEGSYIIERHLPNSHFHLALRISYPNADDRRAASIVGCETGGDIMIHGLPERYVYVGRRHTDTDWTDGCIAVTNREIEEIFAMVADGTTVEIRD
ncbi:MAG: L,D-transpeptidase family protein [Steroidobacteraceae bacterium]